MRSSTSGDGNSQDRLEKKLVQRHCLARIHPIVFKKHTASQRFQHFRALLASATSQNERARLIALWEYMSKEVKERESEIEALQASNLASNAVESGSSQVTSSLPLPNLNTSQTTKDIGEATVNALIEEAAGNPATGDSAKPKRD